MLTEASPFSTTAEQFSLVLQQLTALKSLTVRAQGAGTVFTPTAQLQYTSTLGLTKQQLLFAPVLQALAGLPQLQQLNLRSALTDADIITLLHLWVLLPCSEL